MHHQKSPTNRRISSTWRLRLRLNLHMRSLQQSEWVSEWASERVRLREFKGEKFMQIERRQKWRQVTVVEYLASEDSGRHERGSSPGAATQRCTAAPQQGQLRNPHLERHASHQPLMQPTLSLLSPADPWIASFYVGSAAAASSSPDSQSCLVDQKILGARKFQARIYLTRANYRCYSANPICLGKTLVFLFLWCQLAL